MWSAEFSPDTFLEQTASTFAASLRGRASRRAYDDQRDVSLAWHTAAFSAAAQNGKLKGLAFYLGNKPKAQTPDDMLNTLRTLQDMGAPMSIEEIN